MSGKRRHRQRQEQLEARRRADATRNGVPVDPEALAPYNSYGVPKFVETGYYVDLPFTCQDCGKEEVWAAEQQKWWYEVAKGTVYSTAARCRACRQSRREGVVQTGDRCRYRSPEQFMARIREGIEPRLRPLGYALSGRNRKSSRAWFYLEYARPAGLLSIVLDRSNLKLSAEFLDVDSDEVCTLAVGDLDLITGNFKEPTQSQVDERLDRFVSDVLGALADRSSHPQEIDP